MPGPWKVANYNSIVTNGNPNIEIGRTFYNSLGGHIKIETARANARLMAAAPEMLEALKYVRLSFGDTTNQCAINRRICWIMDSAIAKATGAKPTDAV